MQESDFNPYILVVNKIEKETDYGTGKRNSEAVAYKYSNKTPVITVRIPFVAPDVRLDPYVICILKQIPMKIPNLIAGFTYVNASGVGRFLSWIANQNYSGPINYASTGQISFNDLITYIEKKVGKKAIIDNVNGKDMPFNFSKASFSLSMNVAESLGYHTENVNDWLWKVVDQIIVNHKKRLGL